MSNFVQPHRRQPTRLPCPWDSPGKNTGVGCHFLLQCVKVKSESEVAQSCPTLSNPMDYSLPGSSVHGIFQARVLEWGAIAFSVTSLIILKVKVKVPQSCLTLCVTPYTIQSVDSQSQNTAMESLSLPWGSSQPRDRTQVTRIVVRFFTS